MSSDSEYCSIYVRANRSYELALSYQKIKRLNKIKDKLVQKIIKTEIKLFRLRKQRRLFQKKRRALGARELQNIEKLKIDEIITEDMKIFKGNRQFPAPEILNSFSPRPFSFTVPVGRKGSTDPFLRLLNSPGKNTKVP